MPNYRRRGFYVRTAAIFLVLQWTRRLHPPAGFLLLSRSRDLQAVSPMISVYVSSKPVGVVSIQATAPKPAMAVMILSVSMAIPLCTQPEEPAF
jgi:hypothetical protein